MQRERTSTGDAARHEAAKLSAMLSGMDEGVVFADATNTVVEVNNFFCRFVGLERSDLVGKTLEGFHEGEVGLDAQLVRETDEGVVAQFAITDTGIGIPADKLEAIFEGFEQADISTTRQYGGTGLGLSISSQLVELMGGSLGVESTEGESSTFRFTARFGVGATETAAQELFTLPRTPEDCNPFVVRHAGGSRSAVCRCAEVAGGTPAAACVPHYEPSHTEGGDRNG